MTRTRSTTHPSSPPSSVCPGYCRRAARFDRWVLSASPIVSLALSGQQQPPLRRWFSRALVCGLAYIGARLAPTDVAPGGWSGGGAARVCAESGWLGACMRRSLATELWQENAQADGHHRVMKLCNFIDREMTLCSPAYRGSPTRSIGIHMGTTNRVLIRPLTLTICHQAPLVTR